MCADCGVGLVNQLPPGPEPDKPTGIDGSRPPDSDIQFKHILDTFNATDVAVIKCALDEENIDYWFHGEFSAANLYGSIPMRLMVKNDQVERAREILKGLDLSIRQVTLTDSRSDDLPGLTDQSEDVPAAGATVAEPPIPKHKTGTPSRALKYLLVIVLLIVAFVFYTRSRSTTDSPEKPYAKGEQRWTEHNPSKARSYYEKALKKNPKSDNYYYKIGATYEIEGYLDRALRHYDTAIELNPKNTEEYHRRAYVYLKLGNYERTQKEFDKTIERKPGLPGGYNSMAWVPATCMEQEQRDGEKALQYAQKAIMLAEKNKNVNLAQCYDTLTAAYAETGEFEKAVEMQSRAYNLFRPLYEKAKEKADMKERIDAYKNRETFVQWKSKKPKE